MIPGEKLTETKQENFKKHQLHTPPTPGTGRKGPLPKVGLCGRSRTYGTEMAFWPGDKAGSGRHEAAPKLEDPPQPCTLGAAPGLAWRAGTEPWGTEGPARRMGSGIYLRMALPPTQDSFRQNCDKVS